MTRNARADRGVIEANRPGVMERLGLGPDDCMARNPRLVHGRVTGYSQTGPMALHAGQDIAYIAVTGALYIIGEADSHRRAGQLHRRHGRWRNAAGFRHGQRLARVHYRNLV